MTIYRSDDGREQIRDWCERRLATWGHPHERRVLDTGIGAISWMRRSDGHTSEALLRMMSAPGTAPTEEAVGWMALVGRHVHSSLAPSPVPDTELAALGDVPITVLTGRHDAFLPADRLVSSVRRRLPSATVRIVDGAGHLLPHERPEVVVEELTRPRSGPR